MYARVRFQIWLMKNVIVCNALVFLSCSSYLQPIAHCLQLSEANPPSVKLSALLRRVSHGRFCPQHIRGVPRRLFSSRPYFAEYPMVGSALGIFAEYHLEPPRLRRPKYYQYGQRNYNNYSKPRPQGDNITNQRGFATSNAPQVHETSACGQITQFRCTQRERSKPSTQCHFRDKVAINVSKAN